jgi:hypothetical protein
MLPMTAVRLFSISFIPRTMHKLASVALRTGSCSVAARSVFNACSNASQGSSVRSFRHHVGLDSVARGRRACQISRTLYDKSDVENGRVIAADGHISSRCSCCGLNTKGNLM